MAEAAFLRTGLSNEVQTRAAHHHTQFWHPHQLVSTDSIVSVLKIPFILQSYKTDCLWSIYLLVAIKKLAEKNSGSLAGKTAAHKHQVSSMRNRSPQYENVMEQRRCENATSPQPLPQWPPKILHQSCWLGKSSPLQSATHRIMSFHTLQYKLQSNFASLIPQLYFCIDSTISQTILHHQVWSFRTKSLSSSYSAKADVDCLDAACWFWIIS